MQEEDKARAAQALMNLSTDLGSQDLIRQQGGIKLLLDLFRTAQNPVSKLRACGTLLNMCANDDVRKEICEQDGLAVFAANLADKDDNLAQYCAGAINNLATGTNCDYM